MLADMGSLRVDTSPSLRGRGREADGAGSYDVVVGASGKRDVSQWVDEGQVGWQGGTGEYGSATGAGGPRRWRRNTPEGGQLGGGRDRGERGGTE